MNELPELKKLIAMENLKSQINSIKNLMLEYHNNIQKIMKEVADKNDYDISVIKLYLDDDDSFKLFTY
jgi:hypothetical protein